MAEPRPDMFICKIEYETTKDSTTKDSTTKDSTIYTTLIELGNKSLLYVTYTTDTHTKLQRCTLTFKV